MILCDVRTSCSGSHFPIQMCHLNCKFLVVCSHLQALIGSAANSYRIPRGGLGQKFLPVKMFTGLQLMLWVRGALLLIIITILNIDYKCMK